MSGVFSIRESDSVRDIMIGTPFTMRVDQIAGFGISLLPKTNGNFIAILNVNKFVEENF